MIFAPEARTTENHHEIPIDPVLLQLEPPPGSLASTSQLRPGSAGPEGDVALEDLATAYWAEL
jgi:hypothetical protein